MVLGSVFCLGVMVPALIANEDEPLINKKILDTYLKDFIDIEFGD